MSRAAVVVAPAVFRRWSVGSSLDRAGALGAREHGLKDVHDLIRAAIPAAEADDEREGLAAMAAAGAPLTT